MDNLLCTMSVNSALHAMPSHLDSNCVMISQPHSSHDGTLHDPAPVLQDGEEAAITEGCRASRYCE